MSEAHGMTSTSTSSPQLISTRFLRLKHLFPHRRDVALEPRAKLVLAVSVVSL